MVPLPNEIFGALNKIDSVNWKEFVRTNKGTNFTERPRIALLLGTVIADGFIAVQAEDAPSVKEIGQRVVSLAKGIGVGNSIVPHAKAITEAADKRNWPAVRGQALDQNWWMIGGASVMFAAFLFMRAMTWRRILRGMGHVLRVPPAMRMWSTSELARYLPGGVWQVVGRIYLARPYGIRGSVTSASQIYELTAFLLANLIVAMGCLSFLGYKNLGRMSGVAIAWMIVAAALVQSPSSAQGCPMQVPTVPSCLLQSSPAGQSLRPGGLGAISSTSGGVVQPCRRWSGDSAASSSG